MMGCYSFKSPSANTPAATTRRLPGTPLIPILHPISFLKHSSDRQDSSPKKCFHKQNLSKLSPEPFEFSGAANERLHLVD
jgi:hypothetical protein